MYSIVSVVVGTYANEKVKKAMDNLGFEEWEDIGFDSTYSGGGHTAAWCGIVLDSFDEAQDALDVSKLKLTPTAKQIADARAQIAALDPSVQKVIPPFGVYFVFHTS